MPRVGWRTGENSGRCARVHTHTCDHMYASAHYKPCACMLPPPFHSRAETGMYWDAASGGFYNGGDGKWYSWDADKQQFVEWEQQRA